MQQAIQDNFRTYAENKSEFSPFTYLFTDQQAGRTKAVQTNKGGPVPNNYAVEVSEENKSFHPFDADSRPAQGMTDEQIAGLLGDVYNFKAQVGSPANQTNTFAFVNPKSGEENKIPVGLFSIVNKKVVPETSYPASKIKADGLLRTKK